MSIEFGNGDTLRIKGGLPTPRKENSIDFAIFTRSWKRKYPDKNAFIKS